MNILHVLPGDNFTEGMAYQDNILSAVNCADGHNVMILSSCATWIDSKIEYVEPEDRFMDNGVRLIRKQYVNIINDYISKKLRILEDAKLIIEDFKPDVIRVLNPHNFTLPIVVQYKKEHPEIKLYVDSHQHYFNSGIGFVSYWIFHKLLINNMLKRSYRYIDKILYSEEGVKKYLCEMYNAPEDKMELYPLGGVIVDELERNETRMQVREALGFKNSDILFVHSGKMDEKKNTKQLLEAFNRIESQQFKLVIVGSISLEMTSILLPLIKNDPRIKFLGWKNSQELFDVICAGDCYLQPGSASVTFKQALCCGRPIIVASDIIGYDIYIENGAGWYAKETEEIHGVLQQIEKNPRILEEKGKAALSIAKELLDYNKLAARLYT